MMPSKKIGDTVDLVRMTDGKDFSNLMPRPGWTKGYSLWIYHL